MSPMPGSMNSMQIIVLHGAAKMRNDNPLTGGETQCSRWWNDEQDLETALAESIENGDFEMTIYQDHVLAEAGMCYTLRMECGHGESFVYHPELGAPVLHQWIRDMVVDHKCSACLAEQGRKASEAMYSRPWNYGFSAEELAFYEEAIQVYKKLGRPVTDNEALRAAYDEGYELDILHDPRWRRVSLVRRDKDGYHAPTYELIPEK